MFFTFNMLKLIDRTLKTPRDINFFKGEGTSKMMSARKSYLDKIDNNR